MRLLPQIARQELAKLRAARGTELPPFGDWITRVSPRYRRPNHLQRLIDAIEESRRRPVRVVIDAPPRHCKTETLMHAIPWWLQGDPSETTGYASYSATIAKSKSRIARDLAGLAGISLSSEINRLDEWRTTSGGGMLATGVGGPFTGHGVKRLVVDDPVKNRVEAESATYQERTWDWFNSVAFTRLEPGASVFVIMARWHVNDLAGRLLKKGWDRIHLPALDEHDRPLCEWRYSVEELRKIQRQIGEYEWAALYNGEPRPRGGALFHDVHFYDAIPAGPYRDGMGLDFAYTAKTKSDWSALVAMRKLIVKPDPHFYVTTVRRLQVAAPAFNAIVKTEAKKLKCRPRAYVAGPEKGVTQFMASLGNHVDARPAIADKMVRALPFSAAWNDARVFVPHESEWGDAFVHEILEFTGKEDATDDQVDAGAACYDSLVEAGTPVGQGEGRGGGEWAAEVQGLYRSDL